MRRPSLRGPFFLTGCQGPVSTRSGHRGGSPQVWEDPLKRQYSFSAGMAVVVAGSLTAAGCGGGPLPGHPAVYSAINSALIEHGACSSVPDCERRNLAFWSSGRNRILFSVYSAGSPQLRAKVVESVKAAKVEQQVSYPVTLTFYADSKSAALKKGLLARPRETVDIE